MVENQDNILVYNLPSIVFRGIHVLCPTYLRDLDFVLRIDLYCVYC